jgi:hypothetical protein
MARVSTYLNFSNDSYNKLKPTNYDVKDNQHPILGFHYIICRAHDIFRNTQYNARQEYNGNFC